MPRLLRDREYRAALIQAVERSRRSIEARIFLMDPGIPRPSPLTSIFETLARAKKRGAEVRLETSKIFVSKPSGKRLARSARRFGLPIHWRGGAEFLHEKSVTVDGETHLVGSHNWTPSSLLANRELTLKFRSKEARLFNASEFRRELLEAVRNAQKEITLATYDLTEIQETDSDFADELVRQLIFARMKKRKVRVVLDASVIPRAGEGGRDVVLYRGRGKAEELARWKVHVYYDTTESLFHAKCCVIDGEQVFIGSQNVNPRRDGEVEKTAFLRSAKLARQAQSYLARVVRTSERFRYDPLEIPGVRIPAAWVRRGGVIARIFQRRGKRTLALLLALLHETERLKRPEIPWEEERIAGLAGIRAPRRFTPSVKNRAHYFQRTLTQPRIFLGRTDRLVKYDPIRKRIFLLNGKGKPYSVPSTDFFVLPWEYWTNGWAERLNSGERYASLVHLAEAALSPEAPTWSLPLREIRKRYGISWQRFAKQTVRLERLNLIEIERDPKIVVPNVPKRANRYRVNPLWSRVEEDLARKRLKEEFMASDPDFSEAKRLADLLNQPHDLEVLRKFLVLIERHGRSEVRKAARITARFKPQFALRNVHHTSGILRNWSQGIYKQSRVQ